VPSLLTQQTQQRIIPGYFRKSGVFDVLCKQGRRALFSGFLFEAGQVCEMEGKPNPGNLGLLHGFTLFSRSLAILFHEFLRRIASQFTMTHAILQIAHH
jgi:hypothetical protein